MDWCDHLARHCMSRMSPCSFASPRCNIWTNFSDLGREKKSRTQSGAGLSELCGMGSVLQLFRKQCNGAPPPHTWSMLHRDAT